MIYDTPEKLQRRKEELQKPEIDRLMKQAKKEGGRWGVPHMILYNKFGIEGDFSPSDYGEPQND